MTKPFDMDGLLQFARVETKEGYACTPEWKRRVESRLWEAARDRLIFRGHATPRGWLLHTEEPASPRSMRIGLVLMLLGIAFWLAETWYFGWNLYPVSRAEMVCDHAAVLVFAVGFGIRYRISRRDRA